MNILSQADIKKIYRISGTPENYLTALRYKVWGFNRENKKQWEKLLTGDIIFFHSKGVDSKFLTSSKSCIVGFGVVGNNFFEDEKPLWIDEKLDSKFYPYKFSFSEMFFFSEIPITDDWDSTSLEKADNTRQIINRLLANGILISDVDGFPHMGSFSVINNQEVRKYLLSANRTLNYYKGDAEAEFITKSTELLELRNDSEALRFSKTLTVFDDIRCRTIDRGIANYEVNLDKLATAETFHFNIVSYLRIFLLNKGYKTYSNNHIDLFAHNESTSLLIEAKSIENKNFKTQSRKGIVQLFEYNYFDVTKFKTEHDLKFVNDFKILATSDCPKDNEYIKFINSLNIKTLAVRNSSHSYYGDSIILENL